jgi:RNA recognition motif-containing protein
MFLVQTICIFPNINKVCKRLVNYITIKGKEKMQIYVGNMSYQTTEESLRALFAQYGEVSSVKIITDRETGRAKGFGFIGMEDNSAGQSAIEELNGTEFEGRTLKINEAKPREERPKRNFNSRF